MEITLTHVLLWILLIAASCVCIALVLYMSKLGKVTRTLDETLRETTTTMRELRENAMPIVEKLDITVDALNAELLRVDGIITVFEQASDRMASTSETVTDFVNAPVDLVTGIANKVRRTWKERKAEHASAQPIYIPSQSPEDDSQSPQG